MVNLKADARNLITLTTDFGTSDGYVGMMKGVILNINPDVQCVDITHEISPQNIQEGAFLLANSVVYFPVNTIHVCVVDPGVGSARRPLGLQVGQTALIGPDNGVLSLAARALQMRSGASPRAFHLNNPRYWLPQVSTTFHGRDIFAPCAAHLSRGVPLTEMGAATDEWITLELPPPEHRNGALVGHVVHVDRFGNIISDISDQALKSLGSDKLVVEVGARRIPGLVRAYSDVEPGELIALIGSPWKLEIALREGSAAETLGIRVGDEILVRGDRDEDSTSSNRPGD